MQIGELDSIVETLLPWLISRWVHVAGGLAATGLLVWSFARTGSAHLLNKRLLRLILGKHAIKSPVLAKFAADRDDLMNFRAVTGLKRLPTVAAAERLVHWSQKFDIDIDLIAAAGHHFDVSAPGFTRSPPGTKVLAALTMLTVVFLYGGVLVGALAASMPPVIQVRASTIWYAVTDSGAEPFHFTGAPAAAIDSASCNDRPATARRTGYTSHDIEVVCDLLLTPAGKSVRLNAQRGQVVLGAVAAVLLLLASLILYREMRRVQKAQQLHKLIGLPQEAVRTSVASGVRKLTRRYSPPAARSSR